MSDEMAAEIMTLVYFLTSKELAPGEVRARYEEFYLRAQKDREPLKRRAGFD
jgi:hypothetical protein